MGNQTAIYHACNSQPSMMVAITQAAGTNLLTEINVRTGLKLHLPPLETITSAETQTTKEKLGAILMILKRVNGNSVSEFIKIMSLYFLILLISKTFKIQVLF